MHMYVIIHKQKRILLAEGKKMNKGAAEWHLAQVAMGIGPDADVKLQNCELYMISDEIPFVTNPVDRIKCTIGGD